jgi:di/tricarboxylate transporter
MTLDQALAFGLIAATIGLFIWGRLPYDLVAIAALVIGVLIGIVPAARAFEGFSSEIVIIVAAALVVSEAIARSGVVETLMRPLMPRLRSTGTQVPALAGAVLLLSMVTKNVGALAIFMPIALQIARRTGTSPSSLLMPMAFASLLGGLVTLIGTSPNIIIAQIRGDLTGHPFAMFDFTPVGLSVAVAGYAFLCVGWRLLPGNRKAAAGIDAAFNIEAYTLEAQVVPSSASVGRTVAELEQLGDGDVMVAGIIRERFRRFEPTPGWRLEADDIVLLEGESVDLERLIARGKLQLTGDKAAPAAGGHADHGEVSVIEGVVTGGSPLVGHTPAQLDLASAHGVGLLAVSRSGKRILQRLASVRLRAGDVVVLKGAAEPMAEVLGALQVLPLAERSITLGKSKRSWIPASVLAAAMVLVGLHVVPVQIAFFGAAVVLLLLRFMTMHEAYEAVEWPVLILLGALIPLSEAVHRTGGSELIAGWLSTAVAHLPPVGALAVIMVVVMVVTPFLHNAPTVFVMGPIAASLAVKLGLNPDAFMMAVALGAGCDFVTPIGHQCNTLVMGPGGYRFGDYRRLGAPLSLLVILAGVPLIVLVWGLHK